jgi:hypothetical protein
VQELIVDEFSLARDVLIVAALLTDGEFTDRAASQPRGSHRTTVRTESWRALEL